MFVFLSEWHSNKRGHVTMRAEKLKKRTERTFITTLERLRLRRKDITC